MLLLGLALCQTNNLQGQRQDNNQNEESELKKIEADFKETFGLKYKDGQGSNSYSYRLSIYK
jgi:hypothetical protein